MSQQKRLLKRRLRQRPKVGPTRPCKHFKHLPDRLGGRCACKQRSIGGWHVASKGYSTKWAVLPQLALSLQRWSWNVEHYVQDTGFYKWPINFAWSAWDATCVVHRIHCGLILYDT